jgi:hypothetical protein
VFCCVVTAHVPEAILALFCALGALIWGVCMCVFVHVLMCGRLCTGSTPVPEVGRFCLCQCYEKGWSHVMP